MIGILLVITIVTEIFYSATNFAYANQVNFVVGFWINVLYAKTANHAYYLKQIKGEQGWNPFKDMRF